MCEIRGMPGENLFEVPSQTVAGYGGVYLSSQLHREAEKGVLWSIPAQAFWLSQK
jgi:hypothetical protein